ncbi:glycosyltransferase family 21 protein [Acidomyces richmondensis BFW]|nr:MAG: glycosyltransferase family 21 protein [Acidomyces sp. 'richmondensis']KYG49590.1 glycosyltransferase family 21 protein [Acidomyces richmondensis BFW]
MKAVSAIVEALHALLKPHDFSVAFIAAWACLIWYVAVALVSIIGFTQLRRHYKAPQQPADIGDNAPHVTIIRPIKGLEPFLYECLASTFQQQYPKEKLHVRFCLSNWGEPSLSILQRLLQEFTEIDAQILVEEEDVARKHMVGLGPNPKIGNMSRAYREAKGDVIWIIDCNVWVAKGTLGRMVAKLEGYGTKHKNKFVHQLPLVVDTEGSAVQAETGVNGGSASSKQIRTTRTTGHAMSTSERSLWTVGGGRLEEMFMSTAHAKFYTAINTVLIAPCVVGKSTMFRLSHLNSLTHNQGIDFFSQNICEDHLIGDLLWKQMIPEERKQDKNQREVWGKHALVFGDLAVQPMANLSVSEYWSRRVRWLRVRKFTVTLATLVEPGTESFLCSLYGAYAVTILPFFSDILGIPPTWTSFFTTWMWSVCIWCTMDRILFNYLHSAASISVDTDTPSFARPPGYGPRRPFGEWCLAWLGREALALPIWLWAFYGGTTVEWRGKKFWVGLDMKVHEIKDRPESGAVSVVNGFVGYEKERRD